MKRKPLRLHVNRKVEELSEPDPARHSRGIFERKNRFPGVLDLCLVDRRGEMLAAFQVRDHLYWREDSSGNNLVDLLQGMLDRWDPPIPELVVKS